MMVGKRSHGWFDPGGYRRFGRACQPTDHSIADNPALAFKADLSQQTLVL
jgi:hypothetical protein